MAIGPGEFFGQTFNLVYFFAIYFLRIIKNNWLAQWLIASHDVQLLLLGT